jgi:hypothetical protein
VSEPIDRTVDIILLTHNRLDYLQEMMEGLERHTQWPHRVTIVDNVSGPETRRWLRDNEERFHQIIWNHRNEHLAGHQRGIAATESELFVISDADLIPHPPTPAGCWLTRLVDLADRHPDFGLIGVRLDSVTQLRMAKRENAPVVDGEILETTTGVWLDLIRRRALRVPYMGDGITGYALRRAGYRIGIAANIYCTHLGDQDPIRHPEYLARKQGSRGWGTVYPTYPELQHSARPPLLSEIAVAAPVLAALEKHGIDPAGVVELSRQEWPPLSIVESRVESAVKGRDVAMATWTYDGIEAPLIPGGAEAVAVLCPIQHDHELFQDALSTAREWVLLLSPETVPAPPPGWSTIDEMAGLHPVIERLAQIGSHYRWRRVLGYSTSEHRAEWQKLMRAACFGDNTRLRAYVLHRDQPLTAATARWRDPERDGSEFCHPTASRWRMPARRGGRIGAFLTKATRLFRAEWYLRKSRRNGAAQESDGRG